MCVYIRVYVYVYMAVGVGVYDDLDDLLFNQWIGYPHPRLRRADPNSVLPAGRTTFLPNALKIYCNLLQMH